MHPLTSKNIFQIQIFHDLSQEFEWQGADYIIHVLESNLHSASQEVIVASLLTGISTVGISYLRLYTGPKL